MAGGNRRELDLRGAGLVKPDTSPFDATERPARLLGHVRVMQSKATLDRAQNLPLFLSNLTAPWPSRRCSWWACVTWRCG